MEKRSFSVYKNRAGLVSIIVFCTLIPYAVFAYCSISGSLKVSLPILFLVLLFLDIPLPIVLSPLSAVIELNETGVFYKSFLKKYSMNWAEIREIGLYSMGSSSGARQYVYFSLSSMDSIAEKKYPSKELLMLQYREPVIDAIRTYWSKPVKGLNG